MIVCFNRFEPLQLYNVFVLKNNRTEEILFENGSRQLGLKNVKYSISDRIIKY